MPKKIDPAVKERAIRLVREHRSEYSSLTAAATAVARQVQLRPEKVRRWALQAEIDTGERTGPTSDELAEIKALKPKVRRLGRLVQQPETALQPRRGPTSRVEQAHYAAHNTVGGIT